MLIGPFESIEIVSLLFSIIVFIFVYRAYKEGKFVCIYDKRKNRLDSYTVVRGIVIPFELVDDFIKVLSKVKQSIKK